MPCPSASCLASRLHRTLWRCAGAALIAPVTGAMALDLVVAVSLAETPSETTAKGEVHVALYNRDEDFLKTPLRATSQAVSPHAALQFQFTDLPAGRYAITAYQDLNGNARLDRTWSGRPSEPFAVSNEASKRRGPPRFEQAAVMLDSAQTSPSLVTLQLKP